MKKILTIIFAALALSAFSTTPKFGHINSTELMGMMPELEAATQRLQLENRELESQLRTMIAERENLVSDFQANAEQWSELIRNTRIRAIQDLEQRINEFHQDSERSFELLRESLFAPIIEKIRQAIEEVAKENNYSYIFDTAQGTLLFAADSESVLELVKRKLNL